MNPMEIDQEVKNDPVNFEYTCSAGKQIELLRVESEQTDYLVIGIGTGKTLQFTVDLEVLGKI